MANNPLKILSFLVLIFLGGCNAGVTFNVVGDVKLNDNGTVTNLDGSKLKEKKVLYYGQISRKIFYPKDKNDSNEEIFINNRKNADTHSPERCVYMLWFVPINFWTYFFMTPESLAKQALYEAHSEGRSGNIMRGVNTTSEWFGGLTIGYDCKKLTGKTVSEAANKAKKISQLAVDLI
jgi:hypothetical protein